MGVTVTKLKRVSFLDYLNGPEKDLCILEV